MKYIFQNIITVTLATEFDVVCAYKRARQLAEMTGMNISLQTRFGTAVSEICRNVIEHVGEGKIHFHLVEDKGQIYLESQIIDHGRGIANLEEVISKPKSSINHKGFGMSHAQKLADRFDITTDSQRGTKVLLSMKVPAKHPVFNKAIVTGWQEKLAEEEMVSPYEEIKQQNMQILDVLETLRLKGIETENQLEQIKSLNEDLEKSNQDIRQLLKERDEKNDLLLKMNNELEQFAHTVSHDLKAPLKNIEGLANLLKKTIVASGSEKALKQHNMLYEQIQRMNKLITEVLSYARSGLQNVTQTQVHVADLLAELIESSGVPEGMQIQIGPNMPVLDTEEIYLHQVFSNLLNNAVKYNDQPEGVIQIECERQNHSYQFCIADNGPGIPAEFHEKVFKIFYTLNEHQTEDSSGLGLSIVKKIVTEKGGKVWLESEGRGTRFYFTWPISG
jgi:signal transduction histidine kinase